MSNSSSENSFINHKKDKNFIKRRKSLSNKRYYQKNKRSKFIKDPQILKSLNVSNNTIYQQNDFCFTGSILNKNNSIALSNLVENNTNLDLTQTSSLESSQQTDFSFNSNCSSIFN